MDKKRPSFKLNKELANIFNEMSEGYRYLGGRNSFRSQAYRNAALSLVQLNTSIFHFDHDVHKIAKLKNVGESIAEKIVEYIDTHKIKKYEELKTRIPVALLELMRIQGIGPAMVKSLHEKLNISNLVELVGALNEGKLNHLPQFGKKKIENIARSVKFYKGYKRIPWTEAEQIGKRLLARIKLIRGVEKIEIAGSLRRHTLEVGDIDLVIACHERDQNYISNKIITIQGIAEIISKGLTRISFILKEKKIQVDIRIITPDEFGAALLYFTGPREHTIQLRRLAKDRGLKLNEYGLYNLKSQKRLAGETEEGLYTALGMKYIPPEKRI